VKCNGCEFYGSGYMWNGCSLTESECFMPQDNCDLVNDDGTINYQADYFKGMKPQEDIP